mmetsp:Transcript_8948/g.14516  ORF Transcript_8948/g.14516 Transcript_8948/m.14516 type:complete len:93 (+) Transcript_8948:488-766(+)
MTQDACAIFELAVRHDQQESPLPKRINLDGFVLPAATSIMTLVSYVTYAIVAVQNREQTPMALRAWQTIRTDRDGVARDAATSTSMLAAFAI